MFPLSRKEKKIAQYIIVGIALFLAVSYLYRCTVTQLCEPRVLEVLTRPRADITFPNGEIIDAEVVSTNLAREEGLSGRESLSKKRGLLFVFPSQGVFSFWMKDMKFPIDIIWVNERGVIVDIVENAKPEDYPNSYANKAPALYVLEIPAFEAHAKGAYIGTELLIER